MNFRNPFRSKDPQYDYRRIFFDFNRSLRVINDKTSLISSILTHTCELVPAEAVHLFWESSDATRYQLADAIPGREREDVYLFSEDGLAKWLQLNEKPLTVSFAPEYAAIFSAHDVEVIRKLNGVLVCQLKANNSLKGVMILGRRRDRSRFRSDDMNMLSVLMDNAALAIENISYHEERTSHLKRMLRADRLAVVGQLAAGAAHEIRNPLTSIKSIIQYVQPDIQGERKQGMMKSLLQEVDRINDILSGLLSFSRQNDPVKRPFDLIALVEQTLVLIKNTRLKKQITFLTDYFSPSATIVADSDQIKQVLMNILLNAVDAIREEGVVRVSVARVRTEVEMCCAITVWDSGCGIDPESMEKIFDPFFTTREDGTGLGLSISYGIIQRHRGNIEISSHPEGSTQVVIQLPEKPADDHHPTKHEIR
ncbi:MAG: hypothetical protein LBR08_05125 [Bacteroidales bacterium]|jgi:signal transduction histidine kinase|nr:hypothetical protein [Bacteroidales bacterium]